MRTQKNTGVPAKACFCLPVCLARTAHPRMATYQTVSRRPLRGSDGLLWKLRQEDLASSRRRTRRFVFFISHRASSAPSPLSDFYSRHGSLHGNSLPIGGISKRLYECGTIYRVLTLRVVTDRMTDPLFSARSRSQKQPYCGVYRSPTAGTSVLIE